MLSWERMMPGSELMTYDAYDHDIEAAAVTYGFRWWPAAMQRESTRARARTWALAARMWRRKSARVALSNSPVVHVGVSSGTQTDPSGQRMMPSPRQGEMSGSWSIRMRCSRSSIVIHLSRFWAPAM